MIICNIILVFSKRKNSSRNHEPLMPLYGWPLSFNNFEGLHQNEIKGTSKRQGGMKMKFSTLEELLEFTENIKGKTFRELDKLNLLGKGTKDKGVLGK